MITLLYGGSRTAKFLEGLLRIIDQENFSIIANTLNTAEVFGLEIHPNLEYLLFLLAGKLDIRYWKTILGDTYSFMNSLSYLKENEENLWFRFGDTLIAQVVFRDYLMSQGKSFSEAIEIIAQKLDITAQIIPLTDDKATFKVVTDKGTLPFLEYRNKENQGLIKEVKKIELNGIDKAKVSPKVSEALSRCDTIIIGPSSPPIYIEPMLAFNDIKHALETASCNVIAISPAIGDEPMEEPIKRIIEALGHGTSLIEIVERYPGLIDTLIIDKSDEKHKEQLEEMGMEVIVTSVNLGDYEHRTQLAELVSKLLLPKV
ncbi:2-phospho-L-lactate transferase CofD family protein [Candidatus Borrarchaeum sp.]|uniref:2-phospho-L-lactate transferase CofD family protein n=1 Tax=Candidatus Borrarchaeum sp. TaxID=2846742 RepID=UPI00257AE4BA|nr:2-phospho-L-lactate transferase CofD family protein [Candidatus Borrarchaeum sp.]